MSTKGLMLIGPFALIVAVMLESTQFTGMSISMLAFAGGCLFGKGYGIWEERQRSKAK